MRQEGDRAVRAPRIGCVLLDVAICNRGLGQINGAISQTEKALKIYDELQDTALYAQYYPALARFGAGRIARRSDRRSPQREGVISPERGPVWSSRMSHNPLWHNPRQGRPRWYGGEPCRCRENCVPFEEKSPSPVSSVCYPQCARAKRPHQRSQVSKIDARRSPFSGGPFTISVLLDRDWRSCVSRYYVRPSNEQKQRRRLR